MKKEYRLIKDFPYVKAGKKVEVTLSNDVLVEEDEWYDKDYAVKIKRAHNLGNKDKLLEGGWIEEVEEIDEEPKFMIIDMRKSFLAGVNRGCYISSIINKKPIDEQPLFEGFLKTTYKIIIK